jgi:hypothetical protein
LANEGRYPLADLNEAIVLIREGNPQAALEVLDSLEPDDEDVQALNLGVVRIRALMELRRFEDVIQETTELISNPNTEAVQTEGDGLGPDSVSNADDMSELYSQRAKARWLLNSDGKGALLDAFESLRKTFDYQAADLIAEIRGQVSENARFYRFMLDGRLYEENGIPGFCRYGYFVTCEAVADSIEEAIEYAREVLPSTERAAIRLREVILEEDAVDKTKGLTFMASGRSLFPLEGSD